MRAGLQRTALILGALAALACPGLAQAQRDFSVTLSTSLGDIARGRADILLSEIAGLPRTEDFPGSARPPVPKGDRWLGDTVDLVPRDAEGIPSWIKRSEQVQIPAPPGATAENLGSTQSGYASQCTQFGRMCRESVAYSGIIQDLKAAAARHSGCEASAASIAKNYPQSDPTDLVAAAFDAGCLGSLAVRYRAGKPVDAEPLPAIFTGGADGLGAMSAVGVLVAGDQYFCTGLLRNDRTFVTARHCFERKRTAFKAGQVVVRSAASGETWPVDPAPLSQLLTSPRVRDDWIVLKVGGPAPLKVAEVLLEPLDLAQPLTLVAPFAAFRQMAYPGAPDRLRQSLRFPRDGMCHGLEVKDGCLVLACQTVPGFSGAPLFKKKPKDGRAVVVGFVSQSLNGPAGCPSKGPSPTLAVSVQDKMIQN